MFIEAYKRALSVLGKKPLTLWGLSLLAMFLGILSIFMTIFILPVGIAFNLVLAAGMAKVYLDGLEGKKVSSVQLFSGFKRFWSVAGGMAWRALWLLIWSVAFSLIGLVVYLIFGLLGSSIGGSMLRHASSFSNYNTAANVFRFFNVIGLFFFCICAIAGTVVSTIKTYSYAFVPYILMERPDVSATEAMRLSMEETKGKKGQMFLADLIFVLSVFVVFALLGLLSSIPYLGGIFAVVSLLLWVIVLLFSGIFSGLYTTAFYKMPKPAVKSASSGFTGILNQLQDNSADAPLSAPQEAPQEVPQEAPQQTPPSEEATDEQNQ